MKTRSFADKIIVLPYRGAPTSVSFIRDAALASQHNYAVREFAEAVCQGVQARDYVSEPVAIYHFVCAHCRYTRDPKTIELIRKPEVMISQLKAGQRPAIDCDDMTALICALCLSVGCSTRIVTVAFQNLFYQGQRQYEHVFAEAQDPITKEWIVLDPVAGRRTSEMLSRVVAAKVWKVD